MKTAFLGSFGARPGVWEAILAKTTEKLDHSVLFDLDDTQRLIPALAQTSFPVWRGVTLVIWRWQGKASPIKVLTLELSTWPRPLLLPQLSHHRFSPPGSERETTETAHVIPVSPERNEIATQGQIPLGALRREIGRELRFGGKTGGKRDRVLLGDADVEAALRECLAETVEARP